MTKEDGKPFLWRGMIGGIAGNVVGITILYLSFFNFRRVGPLLYYFFAILGTFPVTFVGGTVVGALVWVVTRLLRTNRFTGAIAGAIIAAIIGGAIGFLFDAYLVQTTIDLVKYGAIAGAVVGAISGADDHTKRS
jgi:hypothetical protein